MPSTLARGLGEEDFRRVLPPWPDSFYWGLKMNIGQETPEMTFSATLP